MYQYIEVVKQGRIATLAFNRPECMNAIADFVAMEVVDAMNELNEDPDVGVVVITGRGRHFCAGGDINRMKVHVDDKTYLGAEQISTLQGMVTAIRGCEKPVIAMINGAATGAGCCVAMACDFRVMTPRSKVSMAFVNLALPGDTGSIYIMMRLFGPTFTTKMAMTGEMMGGEEAYRTGFASYLCEDGKLEKFTYDLAEKLSRKSGSAMKAQKKIMNNYFYGEELQRYFLDEQQNIVWASSQPDFTEAVNAFCEKRTPEMNKGWKE